MLKIAKEGAKNGECKDLVQLKYIPADHFVKEFIHYKKRARKRTFLKNSP